MINLIFIYFLLLPKSHQDLTVFLSKDQTNLIPYTAEFDCVQFSETLIENAGSKGFKAAPVMVGWNTDNGLALHEFVSFVTSDGIVWIEPQNDKEYIVSENSLCYADGECVTKELLFVYYDN